MKLSCVDTNVVLRFLLKDNKELALKAKNIFRKGERGEIKLYLDEVIVAECVWVLEKFYKYKKEAIVEKMSNLVRFDFVINPKKEVLIKSLELFEKENLSFVDCWIGTLSRFKKAKLESFDKNLVKICK